MVTGATVILKLEWTEREGLAGFQPQSRFRERPCLKEIQWRVIEGKIPDTLLGLREHTVHTPMYTYAPPNMLVNAIIII